VRGFLERHAKQGSAAPVLDRATAETWLVDLEAAGQSPPSNRAVMRPCPAGTCCQPADGRGHVVQLPGVAARRIVGLVMKALRAIGRFLGKVMTEGGPPAIGSGGELLREQSMVQGDLNRRQ